MILIASALGATFNWTTNIVIVVSIILLLFKDVNGVSLGKRIFRLKVVNCSFEGKVNIFRSIIRNIPLFLIPGFEIIVSCLNKGRRTGDIIGKTIVVEKEKKIKKTK